MNDIGDIIHHAKHAQFSRIIRITFLRNLDKSLILIKNQKIQSKKFNQISNFNQIIFNQNFNNKKEILKLEYQ